VAKNNYRNIFRGRRLTQTEAAKYRQIRSRVEEEFPPAKSDPVKVAIAKLRAMREAQGVTLAELATRTGMTRGNVARLESQKNATLRTLNRYARALGCELEIGLVSANVKKTKTASALA
jgi:DNA-binding Xre family transcriptional regulator